jgi:hypothetical protein
MASPRHSCTIYATAVQCTVNTVNGISYLEQLFKHLLVQPVYSICFTGSSPTHAKLALATIPEYRIGSGHSLSVHKVSTLMSY